jgi:hypothetical protein
MVAKLERDGKIAILVSRGFGAGWSTWCSDEASTAAVFDPDMAQAVLDGNHRKAESIALDKYPGEYTGGVADLVVEWVEKGSRFEINEYDGSESLRVFGSDDGLVA